MAVIFHTRKNKEKWENHFFKHFLWIFKIFIQNKKSVFFFSFPTIPPPRNCWWKQTFLYENFHWVKKLFPPPKHKIFEKIVTSSKADPLKGWGLHSDGGAENDMLESWCDPSNMLQAWNFPFLHCPPQPIWVSDYISVAGGESVPGCVWIAVGGVISRSDRHTQMLALIKS